jgi:hypothetical protein
MATIRVWLLICFFAGGFSCISAHAQHHGQAAQAVIESLPGSITVERTNNRRTLSVCPASYCTEFRLENADKIDESSVLYLYYFSDYFELKEWRKKEHTVHLVNQELDTSDLKSCTASGSVKPECVGAALKKRGLQVFTVRFEESRENRSRVF